MRRAVAALTIAGSLALAAAGPAPEYRTLFQDPGTDTTQDLR